MTLNNQKIGVITATIIGMNAMIGSGIFSAPAALASQVGPAGILSFLIVIAMVWCMAQSIARVASLFPEEGSFYAYAKQWGGHYVGLAASATYLIGLLIAMGLLAQMAGYHLAWFFTSTSSHTLGLITLFTLVILNMFGVVFSELGQQILICTTIFPLLAIIIMCFTKTDLSLLSPFAPYGYINVFKATRYILVFSVLSALHLFLPLLKTPSATFQKL